MVDVPRLAKASGLFLDRELIVCIITNLFFFLPLVPSFFFHFFSSTVCSGHNKQDTYQNHYSQV